MMMNVFSRHGRNDILGVLAIDMVDLILELFPLSGQTAVAVIDIIVFKVTIFDGQIVVMMLLLGRLRVGDGLDGGVEVSKKTKASAVERGKEEETRLTILGELLLNHRHQLFVLVARDGFVIDGGGNTLVYSGVVTTIPAPAKIGRYCDRQMDADFVRT